MLHGSFFTRFVKESGFLSSSTPHAPQYSYRRNENYSTSYCSSYSRCYMVRLLFGGNTHILRACVTFIWIKLVAFFV